MVPKRVPGRHFVGEAVYVNGGLGGYNVVCAWTTAAGCGDAL